MNFYKVPGVSITVFGKGKILWGREYGLADNTKRLPVKNTTMFQAASISKAVTAFAVLKLAEERGLDIDRDVNEYLTTWKIPANEFTKEEKVTIRRLLNHTAGISVSGFLGYKKTDTIPATLGILLGKGNSDAIIVEQIPGSKFSYSGGGYVILQKLVEDITKMDFARYMQKAILRPLGMNHSTFDQFSVANKSLAHDNNGITYEGGWFIMPELAPAGLNTTGADLAKFCMAVQQSFKGKKGAYLSQKLAAEMLKPGNTWGLGVGVRGNNSDSYFFHGGKNKGFNSVIIDFFNRDFGIVILTNGEKGGTLKDEILRSFSNYYKAPLQDPPRLIKPIPLDRKYIDEFLGTYQWKENYLLELTIDQNNNLVLTDIQDGKVNTFLQTGEQVFTDPNTGEEAILKKDPTDGKLSIRYLNNYTFIKIK